jgi:hypothetical protein
MVSTLQDPLSRVDGVGALAAEPLEAIDSAPDSQHFVPAPEQCQDWYSDQN